jgi:hypothetical protein
MLPGRQTRLILRTGDSLGRDDVLKSNSARLDVVASLEGHRQPLCAN